MTRPPNPDLAERTLDEAELLLAETGPDSINMRGLARRVGVSATALYTYFSSKAELLAQLRLRVASQLNERIRGIDPTLPPDQALHELGVRYVEFAESNPHFYKFLFESLYLGPLQEDGSRAPSPDEIPVLYYTYHQARTHLERLANEGAPGPTPLPPHIGAMVGWIFLHGFSSLFIAGRLQPAEGLDPQQLKSLFLALYSARPQ